MTPPASEFERRVVSVSPRVCPPPAARDCPLYDLRGSRDDQALRRLERAVVQEAGLSTPSLRDAVLIDSARGVARPALPPPVPVIDLSSRKEKTHVPVARPDK